jgi:hypothetical protein
MIWGFDMILHNKALRRMRPAIALTYVEVLELRRMDLVNLLARFPKANKRVRKAVIWLAFKRKFLAHAREIEMLASQIGNLLTKEVGNRDRVRANFKKYDSDGDGSINAQEFSDCMQDLGFEARSDIIENLMKRFDSDNDGKISLNEFFAFFDSYSKESSRLLHLKPTKMFASTIEHHVVDADHGLNDSEGTKQGQPQSVPKTTYLHSSSVPVVPKTGGVGSKSPLLRTSGKSRENVPDHHFFDRDLVMELSTNQASHTVQIEEIHGVLQTQFDVLNHNLALVMKKMGLPAQ